MFACLAQCGRGDVGASAGLLGASFGVAFVVGPAIGGVLMGRDLWLPVKVREGRQS